MSAHTIFGAQTIVHASFGAHTSVQFRSTYKHTYKRTYKFGSTYKRSYVSFLTRDPNSKIVNLEWKSRVSLVVAMSIYFYYYENLNKGWTEFSPTYFCHFVLLKGKEK